MTEEKVDVKVLLKTGTVLKAHTTLTILAREFKIHEQVQKQNEFFSLPGIIIRRDLVDYISWEPSMYANR